MKKSIKRELGLMLIFIVFIVLASIGLDWLEQKNVIANRKLCDNVLIFGSIFLYLAINFVCEKKCK